MLPTRCWAGGQIYYVYITSYIVGYRCEIRVCAGGVVDKWVRQLLWQGDAKVFKKYSQMKLQREAVQKLNRKTK